MKYTLQDYMLEQSISEITFDDLRHMEFLAEGAVLESLMETYVKQFNILTYMQEYDIKDISQFDIFSEGSMVIQESDEKTDSEPAKPKFHKRIFKWIKEAIGFIVKLFRKLERKIKDLFSKKKTTPEEEKVISGVGNVLEESKAVIDSINTKDGKADIKTVEKATNLNRMLKDMEARKRDFSGKKSDIEAAARKYDINSLSQIIKQNISELHTLKKKVEGLESLSENKNNKRDAEAVEIHNTLKAIKSLMGAIKRSTKILMDVAIDG